MDDYDIESPGGRLKWARERVFDEAAEFARAMQMKEVTYRAYENNQNAYAKHASAFAQKLNVPTDWLLRGGPLPDTEPPERPPPGEFGTPELLVEKYGIEYVRQVDISYAMGDGAIVEDYPETGFVPFQRDFLRSVTRSPVSRLFLATGHGESMEPTLLRSDMILIDAAQNRVAQQDQIWALTYAGAGMIKRLRRIKGSSGDRYLILSDNPAVPPQEADYDDVYIVGKVIWVGRRM
jgi:phage repressor protein C with HTH and peptisase S24 domain